MCAPASSSSQWYGALPCARLPGRPEAVEHAQLVELVRAARAARAARAEVQPAQLLGGEDAVLVAGERDQPVALGEA